VPPLKTRRGTGGRELGAEVLGGNSFPLSQPRPNSLRGNPSHVGTVCPESRPPPPPPPKSPSPLPKRSSHSALGLCSTANIHSSPRS